MDLEATFIEVIEPEPEEAKEAEGAEETEGVEEAQ